MEKNRRERPLNKLVYPIFSQEIRQKEYGTKLSIRNEINQIKSQIKIIKNSLKSDRKNPEKLKNLQDLRNKLDSLFDKNFQARNEFRTLRRAIKAECRVLRRRGVDIDYDTKKLLDNNATGDTWKTRLPHMQKLFPAHDDNARAFYLRSFDAILSNFNGEESIERIRDLVDDVMSKAACNSHVINVAALDSIVFGLANKENFCRFITRIMESERLFNEFVKESYHHDLFHKTVLLSGKLSDWKLRMHVFIPMDFTEAQEEVHSHRNHFVSCILHGGFRQEIWEEPTHCNPEAEKEFEVIPFYKYLYDPKLTEDGTRVFNINPLGKIDLARVDQISLSKDDIYYMHPSVLHSVNAIDGCTVTLVLNSPQATEKSCFASLEPWLEESFVRDRFTKDEMTDMVRMVLGLVNGSHQSKQTSDILMEDAMDLTL